MTFDQEEFEAPFVVYFIATYARHIKDVPFPDIPNHEVISIALLQVDKFGEVERLSSVLKKDDTRTEASLLSVFLRNVEQTTFPIVSFQAKRFVLPVLKHRAMRYGLHIPKRLLDTNEVAENYSFHDALESIGLPERPSLNVKKAYEEGNSIFVRSRLEIDVFSLAMLWMRQSIVNGSLSVEAYREIAPRVIDRCKGRSPKMDRFISEANTKMLLLDVGGRYDDDEDSAYSPRDS
jgi:hypothetical protein